MIFPIAKTCFSQWWESPFVVDGQTYSSAEHWMMAEKARLLDDLEIHSKIVNTKSPAEAKKLGRQVKDFDQAIWNTHRGQIVVNGNYHKFSQNPDLKSFLLKTNNRILVEASPVDPIWGIGFDVTHSSASNPTEWRGLNLLGFALMEVRDLLG